MNNLRDRLINKRKQLYPEQVKLQNLSNPDYADANNDLLRQKDSAISRTLDIDSRNESHEVTSKSRKGSVNQQSSTNIQRMPLSINVQKVMNTDPNQPLSPTQIQTEEVTMTIDGSRENSPMSDARSP